MLNVYDESVLVSIHRNGQPLKIAFSKLLPGDLVVDIHTPNFIILSCGISADPDYKGWICYADNGESYFPEDFGAPIRKDYIVKIGSVELTAEEAYRMYRNDMYLVTYGKIYQLYYNVGKQRVFGVAIYKQYGLCRRGRFHVLAAEEVNHLVGFELINTTTFPVVTEDVQRRYEAAMNRKSPASMPMICGYRGRACRQLGKEEGANRMSCSHCPLARFATIKETP